MRREAASRYGMRRSVIPWVVVLSLGLVGMELYARHFQGYALWAIRPQKPNPYFFELDRLKVYNRQFTKVRPWVFRNWPIPLELFESNNPSPRYLFKPNLKMTNLDGRLLPAKPGDKVQWSSNSWGLRGPEFSVQKPAGVVRIVSLGGSTTEGSHGDLETYPHFLGGELHRRFPGRAIEVINAGHHAQGLEDLTEILRQRVLPLKPDIVIFYEVANNLQWQDFIRGTLPCELGACWSEAYPRWYAWPYRYSALFRFLAQRFAWGDERPPPLPHTFDELGPKPGAAHYRNTLRQIVRETIAGGARIVLMTYVTIAHEGLVVQNDVNPLVFDNLYKTWHPFTPGELGRMFAYYNREVEGVAREFGVPLIDMARQFPKDLRYFPFDYVHFSPEGNQVFARIVATGLQEANLLRLAGPGAK